MFLKNTATRFALLSLISSATAFNSSCEPEIVTVTKTIYPTGGAPGSTLLTSATVGPFSTADSSPSSSSVVSAPNSACPTYITNSTSAAVVDLTYAIHAAQITLSPDSRKYYNFSNIRYAAPPVGDLRFKAPQDPVNNRTAGIQDGTYGKICPQSYTPWQNVALVKAPPGENESEDCLFLDVVVPADVWDEKCAKKRPVIVWFHGGGFQIGAKYGTPMSNPLGLLDRSFESDTEGAIWIGLNYRLGALGWLQGSSFVSQGGLPNAGLHDQRKALDWVQKYITLFGGDVDRVTVMGESAGGGAILHHITAYGGEKDAPPFQQAIIQSPGYVPRPYTSQAEDSFSIFLEAAGVTSLDAFSSLTTLELQVANKLSQLTDFYGTFQFGIAPDGDYVPDLPEVLLASGRYHKNIKVISAHNSVEGKRYTDPAATNDTSFDEYMRLYFPEASTESLTELSTSLYPAVYDGSEGYTTPFDRLLVAISDFTFNCHAYFATQAFGPALNKDVYSYLFSVPPGTHTTDVYFTYFVDSNASVTNETVAEYMQGYFTSFAQDGNPNKAGLPEFPTYGSSSISLNINQTVIAPITDSTNAHSRCDWWQKASFA